VGIELAPRFELLQFGTSCVVVCKDLQIRVDPRPCAAFCCYGALELLMCNSIASLDGLSHEDQSVRLALPEPRRLRFNT